MKVSFVDAQSLPTQLKPLFLNCKKLDVAMAYVRIRGLKSFLNILNESRLMKEGKPVKIVFGLSSFQGITDKESARQLLELSRKKKNVKVRKYDNPRFHPKIMIFHGDPQRVLVGSSNLTEGAQSKNAEANVIVENPDTEFWKGALKFFEACFDHAPDLEPKHIESYDERVAYTHGSGKRPRVEDALPFGSKSPTPRGRPRLGAGQPIKSLSYYVEKIRNLESKRTLSKKQRLSLAAYRALKTRYYGAKSEEKHKLAILLSVTHGEKHLQKILRDGQGEWTIGRRIRPPSPKVRVYFYLNRQGKVCCSAILQRIEYGEKGTQLIVSDGRGLNRSLKLEKFRKSDGTNVGRPLQSIAYVLDPID